MSPTNPDMIQKNLEQQEEAEHTRWKDVEANAQRAGAQQAALKPQPLTRPTLDTISDNHNLFLAKWQRYRDGCSVPNSHDTAGIVL